MNLKSKVIIGIFLLIFVLPIFAEETEIVKFPVEVEGDTPDNTGSRFIYQVRQQIRKSSALRLTSDNEPRLKLILSTIDPLSVLPELCDLITVCSVVWTFVIPGEESQRTFYLDSRIHMVVRDNILLGAEDITEKTDELIEETKKFTDSMK